jgi:hypothetical protein
MRMVRIVVLWILAQIVLLLIASARKHKAPAERRGSGR